MVGRRIEPQKTRGKNANRAARVLLATSCQAALHGAHSCVRFRLFRILSYYSSFFYRYRFRIALFYVYRMHARAIFVRASFAVSRIYLRFVRAFSA